jgi:rhodanese-related sulfurtransferase
MKQHSPRFLSLVDEVKKNIMEITSHALKEKLDKCETFYLIDVREDNEWNASGKIPSAIHLSKGIIERDIEKLIPDSDMTIVLYCSGGFRSALTANSLKKMGYTQIYSLVSGLQGWIDVGYDLED